MKKKTRLAAAAGIALLALAGCAPDSGFNSISDYDVVVTHYDPDAEFDQYTTFVVADTLYELGKPEGDDSELPAGLKDLIIGEVEAQMLGYGYTLETSPETNPPDVVMTAGFTQTRWTGYVPGYPWYPGWGWGWGGGYYPGYPWYPGWTPGYTYSYDTGTIIIDYFDYASLDEETGDIEIRWTAGINGVISSSSSVNTSRVIGAIDQAFEQSPYLEKE